MLASKKPPSFFLSVFSVFSVANSDLSAAEAFGAVATQAQIAIRAASPVP